MESHSKTLNPASLQTAVDLTITEVKSILSVVPQYRCATFPPSTVALKVASIVLIFVARIFIFITIFFVLYIFIFYIFRG